MPKISGRDRATARLKGLAGERTVQRVGRALFAGGEEIRSDAVRSITEGSVSGKNHVPSLPGEPPNNDTGTLVSHIEVTQPAPLRVLVTSEADHAVPLETGSSKMAARPYMGPAARRKRKKVVEIVQQAVREELKG